MPEDSLAGARPGKNPGCSARCHKQWLQSMSAQYWTADWPGLTFMWKFYRDEYWKQRTSVLTATSLSAGLSL